MFMPDFVTQFETKVNILVYVFLSPLIAIIFSSDQIKMTGSQKASFGEFPAILWNHIKINKWYVEGNLWYYISSKTLALPPYDTENKT